MASGGSSTARHDRLASEFFGALAHRCRSIRKVSEHH
jgi:hypothetical protein